MKYCEYCGKPATRQKEAKIDHGSGWRDMPLCENCFSGMKAISSRPQIAGVF
jgi:hypothetical protein